MRPIYKKKQVYEILYHEDTNARTVRPRGIPATEKVWFVACTPPLPDLDAADRWADAWEQLGQHQRASDPTAGREAPQWPHGDEKPQPCPGCGNDKPTLANATLTNEPGSQLVWQMSCECGMAAPTTLRPQGATAQWNAIEMNLPPIVYGRGRPWPRRMSPPALTRVRDSHRLVSVTKPETPQEQVQIAEMYQQAGDDAELLAMLAATDDAEPIYTALVVDGEFIRARVFWSPAAADAYCTGAEDVHENAQAWQWPWNFQLEEAYDDDGAVNRVCAAAVEKLQGNGVAPLQDIDTKDRVLRFGGVGPALLPELDPPRRVFTYTLAEGAAAADQQRASNPLHPTGRCTCAGGGVCEWCVRRERAVEPR